MIELTNELVAAIGTSIVTPIVAYLKIKGDTTKRGEKRDTQIALLDQRVKECEKKGDSIDELRKAIGAINISLAKIESLMELFIKNKHME